MRISEIVKGRTNSEQTNREELLSTIDRDCKQYLAAVRTAHKWLLRGHSPGKDSYMATSRYRDPKSSKPVLANLFDEALKQLGFTALRHNSIFATSTEITARQFGTLYIIFPIDGESSFTYTNEHDLELYYANQIPMKKSAQKQEMAALLISWIRQWATKYPDAQKRMNSMYPPFAALQPDWSLEEIMEKVEDFCYTMQIPMPHIPPYLTNWDDDDDDDDDRDEYDLDDYDLAKLRASDIDIDAFVDMYQPRKDHLETALAQGVEVYITGRYYGLKLDVWRDAVAQKWDVAVQD